MPVPSRAGSTARFRSSVSACLLAALAGCSGEGPAPRVSSLLAREPDLRLEERAVLVPDPERQWSARGRDGWRRETHRRADGTPFVVNGKVEAVLLLPATGPAERTLAFDAWVAAVGEEDEERGEAVVRLNGVELGAIPLATHPRSHELATPAEAWRRGRNELTFSLFPTAYRSTEEGLALGPVRYGTERSVARDGEGLRLDPGAGVRYALLPFPGAELWLEGRGAGTAELTLRALEPATARELARFGPIEAAAAEGHVTARLPLEGLGAPPGALVELELVRPAGAAGPLAVERLELVEPSAKPRASVVLVSIDTLSARHLSLYGWPRATSPRLDALAAGHEHGRPAVVFERCRANAPWTSPSYVSLFTGLFPSSVSMDLGGGESRFLTRLPDGRMTLAEALHALGWRTAAFVDALHLDERFGFAQGFEHFDFSAGEIGLEDPDGGFRHILPRALAWLDGLGRDEPFFLFVHVYDVHGPYLPPEPHAGAFAGDALAEPGRGLPTGTLPHTFRSIPEYLSSAWPEQPVPERLPAAPFAAAYDEEVLGVDESFGRLFDALAERGRLDETLVLFTADHGESLDDHDYVGHGLLYEEVLRVPLVAWLPASWPAARPREHGKRGERRVTRSVQLADLMPTLLELFGPPAERADLHGRSFAPLLLGGDLPPAPTFSEGGSLRQAAVELDGWKLIELEPGVESLPWTMLTNPRLDPAWIAEHAPEVAGLPMTEANFRKLMERADADLLGLVEGLREALAGARRELYHLDRDSLEQHDLAAREPEKVAFLLDHLRALQARREEARKAVAEALVPLSDEDLAELEKLGYVEGGD